MRHRAILSSLGSNDMLSIRGTVPAADELRAALGPRPLGELKTLGELVSSPIQRVSALAALHGLGEALSAVEFDIEGISAKLARRPMSKQYALGSIQIAQGLLSDQSKLGEGTAASFDQTQALLDVFMAVGASDDPIPDALADRMQAAVLAAYGQANVVSKKVEQDVKDTFIGQIKEAAKGVKDALPSISDLLSNPLVLGGIAVGAYLLFFRKRSREQNPRRRRRNRRRR